MNTPTAITDHQRSGLLEITWGDGLVTQLPHALLRQRCRCAGCQQLARTGAAGPLTSPALRLIHIETVSNQGLNLRFSDGHGRGIYPWAYLRELATAS